MTISIAKSIALASFASSNIHVAQATGADVGFSLSFGSSGGGALDTTPRFRDHSIPTFIDEHGDWYINASFPPSVSVHKIRLSSAPMDDRCPIPSPHSIRSLVPVTLVGGVHGRFTQLMYASKTAVSPDSASISIRHHGQFLKNVGSISLIRSSSDAPQGTLVVESDRGAFIHTCIPYSDIRVDFTTDYASAFVVSIKEKKARVNRLVLDNTRWRFGHRVNRPALGEIPTVLWNEIDKSLVDSGAIKVDDY